MVKKNNFPKKVLQAMKEGVWYDENTLGLALAMRTEDVATILRMLDRGGLIESEEGKYRKGRKATTRQRSLP